MPSDANLRGVTVRDEAFVLEQEFIYVGEVVSRAEVGGLVFGGVGALVETLEVDC